MMRNKENHNGNNHNTDSALRSMSKLSLSSNPHNHKHRPSSFRSETRYQPSLRSPAHPSVKNPFSNSPSNPQKQHFPGLESVFAKDDSQDWNTFRAIDTNGSNDLRWSIDELSNLMPVEFDVKDRIAQQHSPRTDRMTPRTKDRRLQRERSAQDEADRFFHGKGAAIRSPMTQTSTRFSSFKSPPQNTKPSEIRSQNHSPIQSPPQRQSSSQEQQLSISKSPKSPMNPFGNEFLEISDFEYGFGSPVVIPTTPRTIRTTSSSTTPPPPFSPPQPPSPSPMAMKAMEIMTTPPQPTSIGFNNTEATTFNREIPFTLNSNTNMKTKIKTDTKSATTSDASCQTDLSVGLGQSLVVQYDTQSYDTNMDFASPPKLSAEQVRQEARESLQKSDRHPYQQQHTYNPHQQQHTYNPHQQQHAMSPFGISPIRGVDQTPNKYSHRDASFSPSPFSPSPLQPHQRRHDNDHSSHRQHQQQHHHHQHHQLQQRSPLKRLGVGDYNDDGADFGHSKHRASRSSRSSPNPSIVINEPPVNTIGSHFNQSPPPRFSDSGGYSKTSPRAAYIDGIVDQIVSPTHSLNGFQSNRNSVYMSSPSQRTQSSSSSIPPSRQSFSGTTTGRTMPELRGELEDWRQNLQHRLTQSKQFGQNSHSTV